MRNIRTIIQLFALIAAVAVCFINQIPSNAKIVILLILFALVIYIRRGAFYFVAATKLYTSGDEEKKRKAVTYFEKGITRGLPPSYTITSASVLITEGHDKVGQEALLELLKYPMKDKKMEASAKTALSMVFWKRGMYKEAIQLCEDAKNAGLLDKNLYINLATYYLADGDTNSFQNLMREYKGKAILKSPAMDDLVAAAAILRNNYHEALTILSRMTEARDYTFADPYVHHAMTSLHYGNIESAIEMLQRGKENARFSANSVLTESLIDSLITNLSGEEKEKWAASILSDPLSLINGKMPKLQEGIEYKPSSPDKDKEAEMKRVRREMLSDDRDVNTELTEEDEKWISSHDEEG